MSSLLQPQARKNKIMAACQKNNQPVWPVKLQQEKISLWVGRQVSPQVPEKISQEAGKKLFTCAHGHKQKKQNNQPVSISQGNKQSTCLACSDVRNKTINLCGNSKKNKQNNGSKSPQVGKTTMINMCRMSLPQARKTKLWPLVGKTINLYGLCHKGKNNQHVSQVVGLCKWGKTISPWKGESQPVLMAMGRKRTKPQSLQGGEKEQSTCVACWDPKNNTTIKLCGASRKQWMTACEQQVSARKKQSKVNHKWEIKRTINMCGLLQPQVRKKGKPKKQSTCAALLSWLQAKTQKNNQPVWPVVGLQAEKRTINLWQNGKKEQSTSVACCGCKQQKTAVACWENKRN